MSRGPPYWTVTLSVYVPGQIKIHLDAVPDPRAATAEETVSYWVDDGLLPCTSRHPPGLDVREARLWIDRLRCFSGRVGDVFATREKALRSNQKIEYILRFLKNWNRTYIDDQRFSICEETSLVCIYDFLQELKLCEIMYCSVLQSFETSFSGLFLPSISRFICSEGPN